MTDFPTYLASVRYVYTPDSYLQDCIDEEREPSLEEWEAMVQQYAYEDLVQQYAYEDLAYVADHFTLEVIDD